MGLVARQAACIALAGCLAAVFAAADNDGGGAGPAVTRVQLKAPYHTCAIKYQPGAREFINSHASAYPLLQVRPFSQPPNLVFHYADGTTAKRSVRDHSAQEIVDVLTAHGVLPGEAADGRADADAPRADPPCADEL